MSVPLLSLVPFGMIRDNTYHTSCPSPGRFNRENQDSMAAMEAIPSLAGLVSGENPPEVQAMAAMAIAEICRGNQPNQSAAADLGVVSSIVVLLKHSANGTVSAESAGATWALADLHEANKISFASAGATAPLVVLLATGNERAQNHAAHALASLSFGNVSNLTQVTTLLVSLLGSGCIAAKSRAAASLWRLVQENESCRASIASAGSAPDLVTLLKAGSDDARMYALWSLSLSINQTNQSVVLSEGGIPPLINMLGACEIRTREQSAAALSRLALANGNAQAAIAKAGGIEPLIGMLEAESSSATAQPHRGANSTG